MNPAFSMPRDYFEKTADFYYAHLHQMRTKPLYGGPFGVSGFLLASLSHTSKGLDAVTFMVVEPRNVLPISFGDSKPEAIAGARRFLSLFGNAELIRHTDFALARIEENQIAKRAELNNSASSRRLLSAKSPAVGSKPIPKRRKQIYEASCGKCHYCGIALEIEGRWHIEHKMPKALMGTNEPSNLVASCVPCNMKKRDRTDVEFNAMHGKATA